MRSLGEARPLPDASANDLSDVADHGFLEVAFRYAERATLYKSNIEGVGLFNDAANPIPLDGDAKAGPSRGGVSILEGICSELLPLGR